MEAKAKDACTPLLENVRDGELEESVCVDWRGQSTGGSTEGRGGWKCSICIIGACALGGLCFNGVLYNLVLYLVQVCGKSNAAAANTVSNFAGTALLCSFIGGFLSDAYLGRLWTTVIFQALTTLSLALTSTMVMVISKGPATALESSLFCMTLYLMAISSGPVLPNLMALGADQLGSAEEKQRYFKLVAVMSSTGQFAALLVLIYLDSQSMWVWGFWLCTIASAASLAMVVIPLTRLRQFKASGNPFLRNIQVLVAACRNYSLSLPKDPSLLHESEGKRAVSGCRKVEHTTSLSFLDKAALVVNLSDMPAASPWRLCTVSQVEELKSVLLALPVGIAVVLVATISTQGSTLFEEQASEMNRLVTSWLVIPPASLNLISMVGSILAGILTTVSGPKLWSGRKGGRVTSLQLQGGALVSTAMAMLVAAVVESYRLSEKQKGTLLSVMWLVPQALLVGAASNLVTSGGADFFYSQLAPGMRSVGSSFFYIFMGAGNYLSTILVALVTALSTRGGRSGWIADDLNDGHVDYFYWLLMLCLVLALGIHIAYARFLSMQTRN
ncbi:hypothetical protein L7F22_017088 [Adiantum nelumboides]|nr:hypothetical protein [Adiantum nelumboides]